MATYNTPLITNQGLSLLKAEIAGNDSVTFTKIVFSSDDYSQTADSSVQALTALSSLDLIATARSFTDVNGNLKIRGVANNQNTTSAFYIKTYGLYGKNKAGNEMLIAVSTAQNANFVPAYNGKQTNQIAYTFNIAISSTNNITLSSSTDVDVTQADLAGINSAVNSNASSLSSSMSSVSSSLSSSIANNSNAINTLNNIAVLRHDDISVANANSLEELRDNYASGIYVVRGNYGIAPSESSGWGIIVMNKYPSGDTFLEYHDVWFNKKYVTTHNTGGWGKWATQVNEGDLNSILQDLQGTINNNSSSISSLSTNTNSAGSAISSNSANIASNASAISSNANSTSSAISSVSSSNNAVSSSIASTVSVNQSNIANNSSAISNLQSSVATNSSAIASNSTQISANSTANSQAINQITSNIQNVQGQVNTVQGNALQYQGVWQGHYWDWASHKDGIYTIDKGQNPLDGFFNGAASNFSGWGTLTLTSTANGNDRYCVMQDNLNHMFRNHLFVIPSTFSGWIQY